MNNRFQRLQNILQFNLEDRISLYASKPLHKSYVHFQHFSIQMANHLHGVVIGFDNKHYLVDFTFQYYSYGRFQQLELPSDNVIICLNLLK